jgi:N-lysine methyltransferase SETD6
MVANTVIPQSTEVFNTYGETLSNAELLTRYGFILDANENDRVTWTFAEVFNDLDVSPGAAAHGEEAPTEQSIMERLDNLFTTRSFLRSANESAVLAMPHSEDSTITGSRKSNMLFIDSDGKASVGLWLALLLIAGYRAGRYNLESGMVVKELMEFLNVLATMTGDDASAIPSGFATMFFGCLDKDNLRTIHAQGQYLVQLCETRKKAIGKPGESEEAIGDILDVSVSFSGEVVHSRYTTLSLWMRTVGILETRCQLS